MSGDNYVSIPDNFQGYKLEHFCIPQHYKGDLESVFLPCGLVHDRIERMAQDIVQHYNEKPFRALCVLKGGYRFFADMLDRIRQYYHFGISSAPFSTDFIRVKSYVDDKSTGNVTVVGLDNMECLKGKNLLIVEDIIDTGRTMAALLEHLKTFEPNEIKVARWTLTDISGHNRLYEIKPKFVIFPLLFSFFFNSLFVKRSPGSSGYRPDYCGFEIPDKFVVGYALDYNDHFRDLSHVCTISNQGKQKYADSNGTL